MRPSIVNTCTVHATETVLKARFQNIDGQPVAGSAEVSSSLAMSHPHLSLLVVNLYFTHRHKRVNLRPHTPSRTGIFTSPHEARCRPLPRCHESNPSLSCASSVLVLDESSDKSPSSSGPDCPPLFPPTILLIYAICRPRSSD